MAKERNKDAVKNDPKTLGLTDLKTSASSQAREPIVSPENKQKTPIKFDIPKFDDWVRLVLADENNKSTLKNSPKGSSNNPKDNLFKDPKDTLTKDDTKLNVDLTKFGLKSSAQVIQFLHSPSGKITLSKIKTQLAIKKALEEELILQNLEQQLMRMLFRVFMFLMFFSKKSNASAQLRELTLQLNERNIKRARGEPREDEKSIIDRKRAFEEAMMLYQEAIEHALENIKEGEVLDVQMSKLLREGQQIEDKYAVWESSLADFLISVGEAGDLTQLEIEERISSLAEDEIRLTDLLAKPKFANTERFKNEKKDIQSKIITLKDMLAVHLGLKLFVDAEGNPVQSIQQAALIITKEQRIIKDNGKFYLLNPGQEWNSVKNDPVAKQKASDQFDFLSNTTQSAKIESRIHKLCIEMNQQADDIQKLIEIDHIDEAISLKDKHVGLNLKLANLHDMLSVHRGEKRFVDEKGNTVDTLNKASYVLPMNHSITPANKHVIEKEGVFYLLPKNQDWDSIKDSPEAQEKARQDYQVDKMSKMTVKAVVFKNKDLETAFHQERVEKIGKHIEQNQAQSLNVANQLRQTQVALANILELSNQLSLTPKLTPTNSNTNEKISPALAKTHLFKSKIQEVVRTPSFSQDELYYLAEQAPESKREAATSFLQSNMPRGIIPTVTMQFLLRNLEQLGVDLTKVPNSPSDATKKFMSPFKITPDPYKT
jgi:effector protein LidA